MRRRRRAFIRIWVGAVAIAVLGYLPGAWRSPKRASRNVRPAGPRVRRGPPRILAPSGRVKDARPDVRWTDPAGGLRYRVLVIDRETGAVLWRRAARGRRCAWPRTAAELSCGREAVITVEDAERPVRPRLISVVIRLS